VDVFANFADPGYEYKETMETGARAAAAGGFTDVFVIPNTNPVLHNKAGIEYIVQKSKQMPVNVHPIGSITKNTEGKELAEMYDMQASGAKAFSDGIYPVQSPGVIMQLPDDNSINPHGLMNEGIISTKLGLPGKPIMAEELVIARDIKLARYAESKIHFTGITGKRSIEYIKRGRENTSVTCSVTPHHLFFTEEDLSSYDSNLKVNPPLRTKEDRKSLRKAVLDGVIDCIATHHLPHETDSKMVEFEYAKFGMIGLETAFAVIQASVPEMEIENWVKLLSINPRKIFGLEEITVDKGSQACLTLFNPNETWTVSDHHFHSKSRNSPFKGKELKGRVIGIINKDRVFLND
jgi:dihydroorotase